VRRGWRPSEPENFQNPLPFARTAAGPTKGVQFSRAYGSFLVRSRAITSALAPCNRLTGPTRRRTWIGKRVQACNGHYPGYLWVSLCAVVSLRSLVILRRHRQPAFLNCQAIKEQGSSLRYTRLSRVRNRGLKPTITPAYHRVRKPVLGLGLQRRVRRETEVGLPERREGNSRTLSRKALSQQEDGRRGRGIRECRQDGLNPPSPDTVWAHVRCHGVPRRHGVLVRDALFDEHLEDVFTLALRRRPSGRFGH
jgi:hypothetical protein